MSHELANPDDGNVSRERADGLVEIGQWYWVKDSFREEGAPAEWLGCVMHVGSNYLELQEPSTPGKGCRSTRVHFDDFWQELRFEPNAAQVIAGQVVHYQQEASRHLKEIKEVTARLGVAVQGALPASVAHRSASGQSNALAVMGQGAGFDVKKYELDLVEAKDKTLPDLFKAVEVANANLTKWMTADTLPLKAMAGIMEGSIDSIKDRIFNVSLYAGLTEEVVQCCDGAPAAPDAKLHVMQRMLFMDEECLVGYRTGGMEFKDLGEFDRWLSEPDNRDRVLPHPRCLVAMRVRRNKKERESGTLLQALINIDLQSCDKLTFLYLRNGERVSRLNCDLDFDELLFPDRSVYDPGVPMMAKIRVQKVDELITRDDYDVRVAKYNEECRLYDEWKEANPGASWMDNPHRHVHWGLHFNPKEWQPFDTSSAYYDDIAQDVAEQIKKYNRVATIIQGLFDRSEVFHPHHPVRTWTQEGFEAAITLVYDGTAALHAGEKPDFEAYRASCNASLNADSVVIGQELYWMTREAEKENNRIDNDWRIRDKYAHHRKIFKPRGNPGPGYIARMDQWKPKSRQAVFSWNRERQTGNRWGGAGAGDNIRTTLTVPDSRLFNVSAYRPGDFRQFFRDPRTRAEYLQWAPLLLAAEEYHAGNMAAQAPVPQE